MTIQISAVIPTYNREKTIGRAILSVLEQQTLPAEIIIIDDGSTDKTKELIKPFGDKIRYVYQNNCGVSSARNMGVKTATNDWVAFLDSDDYWLPSHLSNLTKAIEITKGEAACYFTNVNFSPKRDYETWWDLCQFTIDHPFALKSDGSEWAFMNIQPILLQASVINRSAYINCGGLMPNMKTREDTLLFYKLALQYPICAVSGCGTTMTDDADYRLTEVYDPNHIDYRHSTIMMYSEILSSIASLDTTHRMAIERKLADVYTSMGAFYIRRMELINALNSLMMAIRINPSQFIKTATNKVLMQLLNRFE